MVSKEEVKELYGANRRRIIGILSKLPPDKRINIFITEKIDISEPKDINVKLVHSAKFFISCPGGIYYNELDKLFDEQINKWG